jgi:hypothetical protein
MIKFGIFLVDDMIEHMANYMPNQLGDLAQAVI